YLHEAAAGLEPEAMPLLQRAEEARPPEGTLRIAQYAIVNEVFEVTDERRLAQLAGQHVWSPQTIGERFHYRRPGLFVLLVRTYARSVPHVIPDSPHFGGCRSWVELPGALSTDGLSPVLSDEDFERRRDQVRLALAI